MPLSLLTAELLAKSTKSSSGSSGSLIFLVIIVGFFALYFLVLRPRSRRARQQSRGGATLTVGDEVVSAGGILGTITAIAGDEIVVEVSPGVTLTFWRRAINLRSSVPGAPPSGAPAGGPSVPSYPDEPYTDESYTDEPSYPEESYNEESYGDESSDGGGEDQEAEMTEADHRDSSGGPGEGR